MKIYQQKSSGDIKEVQEGFNIWALLFGVFWYLYKGMIKQAFFTFIGMSILVYVFNMMGFLGWIYVGSVANRSYADFLESKGYTLKKSNKTKNYLYKTKKGINPLLMFIIIITIIGLGLSFFNNFQSERNQQIQKEELQTTEDYSDIKYPIILSYPEHNINISFLKGGDIHTTILILETLPSGQILCDEWNIVDDPLDCVPSGLLDLLNSLYDYSKKEMIDVMCQSSGGIIKGADECMELNNEEKLESFELSCRYSHRMIPNLDSVYSDRCLADYVDWFVENELDSLE